MTLFILRCVFVLVAAGLGLSIITSTEFQSSPLVRASPEWGTWGTFFGVMFVAMAAIVLDVLFPRKRIDLISCVFFGIVVGLFLTYVVGFAMVPVLPAGSFYHSLVRSILAVLLCYACISLLIQTKDDFRFIIPYVEFAREVKGLSPYVLDTSVVIDGRIADVVETHLMDSQLIMPRFILMELQGIADSSDKLRRTRGRRGLDILRRLQDNAAVDLKIHDHELPEMENQPNDLKLVLLAKHLGGKVVTGDYNLNKVAKLHDVEVINLNDVANALKPVFLPGESLELMIVKRGEEPGQGVGYLDDGTMIVVEGGSSRIHQQVRIAVTSVLQTSAGRMIFGKVDGAQRNE